MGLKFRPLLPLLASSPESLRVRLLVFFQTTMQAGPWLKGFGWGTDKVENPEEIYPAISAEEAAKLPASPGTRDKAERGQSEGEPQHEAETEAAAEAHAEAAQGPLIQGKRADQREGGPTAQVWAQVLHGQVAWRGGG